ncbi:hypothetical protein [Priestia aryabhattai]|uniref:hypothetical protein n=1 Tax=Priestia aryabhattai TaxID=412384 RepID=UPI000D3EB730|nr:hypothetical protein C2I28_26610 [Priestia megaterium]UPK48451.1 hypothetical protein MT476_17410 [Bacillus sp. H8-1]
MDFIFNFIDEFIESIVIMWLVSFVLEKLDVYRLEKKVKWKLIFTLSIVVGIIFSIIDLF